MTFFDCKSLCLQLFAKSKNRDWVGKCIKMIFLTYLRFLWSILSSMNLTYLGIFLVLGFESQSTSFHKHQHLHSWRNSYVWTGINGVKHAVWVPYQPFRKLRTLSCFKLGYLASKMFLPMLIVIKQKNFVIILSCTTKKH